jgi:hypothetical protein
MLAFSLMIFGCATHKRVAKQAFSQQWQCDVQVIDAQTGAAKEMSCTGADGRKWEAKAK